MAYKNGFYTPTGSKYVTNNNKSGTDYSYAANNAAYNMWKASNPSAGTTGTSGTGSSSKRTSSGKTSIAAYSSGSNYNSLVDAYIKQKLAALNSSYNNNKSNINAAYDKQNSLLGDNYNSAVNALNASYNNSLSGLKKDAEGSLREAYVNNEISKRDLNQNLTAQGITGGAAESTMAGLSNNYGNSRNNINTTLNTNIGNLDAEKTSNLASLLQAYNSNLANSETQRASQLAQIEQAYQDAYQSALANQLSLQTSNDYLAAEATPSVDQAAYQQALQNAIANQNSYTGTKTSATNSPDKVSVAQADTNYSGTKTNASRLANIKKLYSTWKSRGISNDQIVIGLSNAGYSSDEIANALR